jgi:hypothetical protein
MPRIVLSAELTDRWLVEVSSPQWRGIKFIASTTDSFFTQLRAAVSNLDGTAQPALTQALEMLTIEHVGGDAPWHLRIAPAKAGDVDHYFGSLYEAWIGCEIDTGHSRLSPSRRLRRCTDGDEMRSRGRRGDPEAPG